MGVAKTMKTSCAHALYVAVLASALMVASTSPIGSDKDQVVPEQSVLIQNKPKPKPEEQTPELCEMSKEVPEDVQKNFDLCVSSVDIGSKDRRGADYCSKMARSMEKAANSKCNNLKNPLLYDTEFARLRTSQKDICKQVAVGCIHKVLFIAGVRDCGHQSCSNHLCVPEMECMARCDGSARDEALNELSAEDKHEYEAFKSKQEHDGPILRFNPKYCCRETGYSQYCDCRSLPCRT